MISNWFRNAAAINATEEHNNNPVKPEYTKVYRAVITSMVIEIL